MRRELVWALVACLLISAWALLNPATRSAGTAVVAPVARVATISPSPGSEALAVATAQPSKDSGDEVLPAAWPEPAIEPATRSPFSSPTPAAPKIVAPAPIAPPAVPTPPPPQANYRFWGSLSTPSGERLLYVVRDDNQGQPTPVQVGTRLDDGFVVEQITAGAIVLTQTGSARRVTLSLSPPPGASQR